MPLDGQGTNSACYKAWSRKDTSSPVFQSWVPLEPSALLPPCPPLLGTLLWELQSFLLCNHSWYSQPSWEVHLCISPIAFLL